MNKPNIIVIVADDMGFGDIGISGNKDVRTPNLDRIAREGVILNQHYSASPMCAPARAALLTGKYPHRTGAVDVSTCRGYDRIALDEITVADLFKQNGYRTGLIGKWHNGRGEAYHPMNRGFESFTGFRCGGSDYWSWMLEKDHEPFPADGRYLTDVFSEEAASFIQENQERPFFLMLTYNAPHTPLQAPEEEIQPFRDMGKFSEAVCTIYAMIKRMDYGIGTMLNTLADCKIEEETIILFVSDNGPDMKGEGSRSAIRYNSVLSGTKGSVLEGGIRVPGLLKWPGKIEAGTVYEEPVHFTDWLLTLASAAGISLPPFLQADGRDMLSLLRGLERKENDFSKFWQWNRFEPVPFCNAALRKGPWKLVYPSIPEAVEFYAPDQKYVRQITQRPDLEYPLVREPIDRKLSEPSKPLLYHLTEDPSEEHDRSESHSELCEEMKQELDQLFDELMKTYKTKRILNVEE
ncbi:sulfatase-like hydrolase/transferase [Paenibacillus sp. HB172176]|uniref:sulfatase-like hydrolase/transferase n=1 Tax=Paenibacillus sp. HB172176 TaxID=2493690 RepID=UPI00143BFDDA|nr:sulfatase-like hydrolase/transferase [Paenibacillus sp. HB172176]